MSWQTAAVSTQIWLHELIRNCLKDCKEFVMKKFVNIWQQELTTQKKPILRTYSLFKNYFFIEHHLESITDFRYRTAITKLRCSSHALETERGRYQILRSQGISACAWSFKLLRTRSILWQIVASTRRSECSCIRKYRATFFYIIWFWQTFVLTDK